MAKIDLVREKFKDKVKPIDFIEIANKIDDSKTKKYTEHMVRFTKNLFDDFYSVVDSEMRHIISVLKNFDELAKNGAIETPDLNQYRNLSSVNEAIKNANLMKSIGKAKKEIKVLYEDDKYMLFLPLSYDAATIYGKGTRWCVTQESYFYRYTDKGILAYFIEKGINRKIGLYYDMDKSYYYENFANKKSDVKRKTVLNPEPYEKNDDSFKFDSELYEIYEFSRKFSCWTDKDDRIDMMFLPIPLHIRETFINYCSKNNIQNASLLDKNELENYFNYFKESEQPLMVGEYMDEVAMVDEDMGGLAMGGVAMAERNMDEVAMAERNMGGVAMAERNMDEVPMGGVPMGELPMNYENIDGRLMGGVVVTTLP